MDALTFIGNGIFFTIGVCVGAAIMYFGGLLIDKINSSDIIKGGTAHGKQR